MNYEQILAFLYASLPQFQKIGAAAYKANLDTTLALDKHFKSPHHSFKTIHVAGTNGKGSVSSMIYNVLVKNGYKVGLYTSPHLIDFRERIVVNDEMISKDAVVEFVEKNKEIIERLKPSFFEMTVAMAFEHFKNCNVDYAVVEVGMGGRLDSTNIITPILSVVTNISFDHTRFLGRTLEKIAAEKAGIIKSGVPIVLGERFKEIEPVFKSISKLKRAELVYAQNCYECVGRNGFNYKVQRLDDGSQFQYRLGMEGEYQCKNICTALTVIDKLKEVGVKISQQSIELGLQDTVVKGRWQVIEQDPMIVCDTAHNVAGMRYVIEQILMTKYKKLYIVLGFVKDKDIDEMLKIMPRGATYFFTQPSIPRALPAKELALVATGDYNLYGKEVHSVTEAIRLAKKAAKLDDFIFVGGSTFVVADAIENL